LAVKQLLPNKEIIIAADNDFSGVGQTKAVEAALAIQCKYIVPPVCGLDFNDFLNREGL
jgi:putative DNA primase/helicase